MDFNNVLIVTTSKQDQNYIDATTKLDNANFNYSVVTLPGCATKLKNTSFPLFFAKDEKKSDAVRRILGLC